MNGSTSMRCFRPLFAGACLAGLAGCATLPPPAPSQHTDAATSLQAGRSGVATAEHRAAHYLHAAVKSAPLLGSGTEATAARETYNAATAELTILLRSADGGRLWNKPLTLPDGSATYQLRLQPGNSQGVWAPDYFTEFKLPSQVNEKLVKNPNRRPGVGGVLVGVRKASPREEFVPRVGVAGAVTATLGFNGKVATLTLNDPTKLTTVRVAGNVRPLAADFSAPLCYYPEVNELFFGLMAGLRPEEYAEMQGIYFLQPPDPSRIPVFYVHGLISSPYIWRDVVNQINGDPELRAKYQPVVYAYPTGNPFLYSALKFREALAAYEKRHGLPRGFVLVSHSMGGLLSQSQATTITQADWHKALGARADAFFAKIPPDGEIHRAVVFKADPKARRVVFIATPHKGAEMADQTIGKLAMKLIRLPLTVTNTITKSLGSSISLVTDSAKHLPDSVSSLSPENPTLKVLASKQVVPPCHSIIGNQGKPGPLAQSSDSVVPYWSSHLDYAKSEVIAPGPHGCYGYPEAIKELKRILHLDLRTARR
jgi:hypothetical protein